ncbi:ATP-binding protein [Acidobacterium sp. S8]|uniref:ATP-binding protein n=1 Tax=Acidobacterium sp. S8 TaxID=1641854 RepID=UPI00131CB02F|nr:ATP-binding protein [Acidobacterium sp. S8]
MTFQQFQQILRQAFFVPLLTLLALAGLLLWQVSSAQDAQRWLDHSDRVSAEIAELERNIVDQQTALRGYELTGDRTLLNGSGLGSGSIRGQFDLLQGLVSDNPQQIGNLVNIKDRYQLWLGFANDTIGKPFVVADKSAAYRGTDLMNAVRAAIKAMGNAEDGLRAERLQKAINMERQEIILIIAGTLAAGFALSFFSLMRLRQVSNAHQRSLREIEEGREWLRTTLRSIGDAVIVCSAESAVQFMNPVAEELTGWPRSEAEGKPLQQVFHIIHEQTREEAENPVEKVRRLNKVIGLANHTALLSRTGAEYIIDDSAAPIFDKSGVLVGIVLVFRDVTEQRRSEAALIASEKLAVAGRLAASIAHEIHNPLDSVANLHYLISREENPERRGEYLNMAEQELKRTLQISRTMLNLYREPNDPVKIDLNDLLEGVLLLLQRRIQIEGVNIQREFEGTFIIEGFPAELRQVFTNLITNAVDAARPNGNVLIRLTDIPAEEFRGAGVAVEIIDSGPGITEQASQKLFQPFFTTKGEQGTGLGLWVTMGIVQKHGGTIRLQNSNDPAFPGACARVFLPAHTLATSLSRTTAHMG